MKTDNRQMKPNIQKNKTAYPANETGYPAYETFSPANDTGIYPANILYVEQNTFLPIDYVGNQCLSSLVILYVEKDVFRSYSQISLLHIFYEDTMYSSVANLQGKALDCVFTR